MSNSRQVLGERGEKLAVDYLKNKKYSIISCNYRNKLGEIDIIALNSGDLVFVEVKTRSTSAFGSPAEAVSLRKQHQIIKVAQLYLQEKKLEESSVRFDVVSVIINKQNQTFIEIIRNAFEDCG